MRLFEELIAVSNSVEDLERFLYDNMRKIYDFYDSSYSTISESKESIKTFLQLKRDLLENINYTTIQNKAFISILFDLCERFGLIETVAIENTLQKREIYLGKRREAAKLFLLQIRDNDDYLNRFEDICKNLDCAIQTEEDNSKMSLVTFANYFAKVVLDTSEPYILALKSKIVSAQQNISYSFINHAVILRIISVDTSNNFSAYKQIQNIIEEFLGRLDEIIKSDVEAKASLLIEKDSDYSKQIVSVPKSFKAVRQISVNSFQEFSESDKNIIYNSLARGVIIITNEAQMYSYMNSFGNIHYAKILSALKYVNMSGLKGEIELFDWGCGQSIASITFLEHLTNHSLDISSVKNITLIEPSLNSIKRAALHVRHFHNTVAIKTINKSFNSLAANDVKSNPTSIKIHFLSNVLDMDEAVFSMTNLINLIEKTQKGINYFICASPYITDIKTDRVDSFKRHFKSKNSTFNPLGEETEMGKLGNTYWQCNHHFKGNAIHNSNHSYCRGSNKWSKVIRVFSTIL